MNIKDHFCLSCPLLQAIALYPTQENWQCLRIRNLQYTEFHISNFWSRRSLGENVDILVRWDLTFKQILITKPKKIKICSVRALKRYLNEKNLINGRVMATISKFSPQIFETYFSKIPSSRSLNCFAIILQLLSHVSQQRKAMSLVSHARGLRFDPHQDTLTASPRQ